MPDTTARIDSGLGRPSRKRRGAIAEVSRTPNGTEELTGGSAESVERIENAPRADASPAAFPLIDPLDIPADAGSGDGDSGAADQPRKRRGRKPGSHNRTKEAETVSNLSSLLKIEKILISSAFFLSNIAGAPELLMEPDQARDIREAIEELARLYPIGISEKKVAWTNFAFAVGGWAGPGLVAMYKKPARPRPTVVPTPIREQKERAAAPTTDVSSTPSGMVNGLANPVTGVGADPAQAKTPSQMWNQPGDIPETDGE